MRQSSVRDLRLFNFVNQQNRDDVKRWLEEANFVTFELPLNLDSGEAFWEATRNVLPFDPSLGTFVVWDGFADSLFGGLDELRDPRVAIIWDHVEQIVTEHLEDFVQIVSTLEQVALQVSTPTSGIDVPVQLVIFLLGEGPNFPKHPG